MKEGMQVVMQEAMQDVCAGQTSCVLMKLANVAEPQVSHPDCRRGVTS
ncbi:hypothetical protein [Streptomyces tropicalis]|nr:hypothetical protein [Streptomyces tropicalis]